MAKSKNPQWLQNVIDKPYNRISWLISHNAFNSVAEIKQDVDPNQHYSINDQLADGVRAFMIDIHPARGGLRLQHGPSGASSYEDFCEFLGKIKSFLIANPKEVVTLYCESYGDNASDIVETFAGRGPGTQDFKGKLDWDVSSLVYHRPQLRVGFETESRNEWPTIQELIDTGKRLVVFRELHDGVETNFKPLSSWYLDQWLYTAESPWNCRTFSALQENTTHIPGRGRFNAPIFTLYHQPSGTTGGSAGFASTANVHAYLFARAMIAWKLTGKRPSPAVDFYRTGGQMPAGINTLDTCAALNQIKEVHGRLIVNGAHDFGPAVLVEGVANTTFASRCYGLNLGNYSTTEPVQQALIHGRYSFPLVAGETVDYRLSAPGFQFTPDRITVSDHSQDVNVDIHVHKLP